MYTEKAAKEQAKRGAEITAAHGFEAVDNHNFAGKCMLIVSELHEGWESVYEPNPEDPLDVELADTAIRLGQVLHNMWGDKWNYREPEIRTGPALRKALFQSYEQHAWGIIAPLSKAVEAWRKGRASDVQSGIELAFKATVKLAYELGYDLEQAIEAKLQKNANRPRLHGKVQTV